MNMWDLAKQLSHRKISVRNLSLFATIMFVATFVWSVAMPTTVFAEDASWDGENLMYQGHMFGKMTDADYRGALKVDNPGLVPYSYSDATAKTLGIIYVHKPADGKPLADATQGQYVLFKDFTPPDTFKDRTEPEFISLTKVTAVASSEATGSSCDSSIFQGLGWILCPASNVLASAVDNIYSIVSSFLVVTTLTTDQTSSVYKVWKLIVGLANVCFLFAFLYIVYAHLTSMNVERYHLFKKSLPRLLIAAVLVNISYWICALGVDISNFLGYSVEQLFRGVRESVGLNVHVDWSKMTGFILSAGSIGGFLGFAAATGGSFTAAGFLLLSMLVSVVLAALVAFIILAARQALIVIFIIIAPFAFVAWVLPNTEKYFDKWLKAFMSLLMMFPIFSALFGGSMLAGAAIMNSANGSLIIALIGMAVQIVPLILTPIIIRFSTGILGQIANITNNRKRGIADRTRNWSQASANTHAQAKRANTARDVYKRQQGELTGVRKYTAGRGVGRVAYGMDQSRRKRDLRDKDNEEVLSSAASADYESAVQTTEQGFPGKLSNKYASAREGRHQAHVNHKIAEEYKSIVHDEGEAHWNEISRNDLAVQALRVNRVDAQEASNVTSERWNKFIADIQARGGEAPEVAEANKDIADRIRRNHQEIEVVKSAQDAANRITQQNFAKALQENEDGIRLRAKGIGDDNAEARVLAKAKSTVSAAMVDDIKNIEATMDYNLAKDSDRLSKMITQDRSLSFEQKVAYTRAMAKNGGPGNANLRKVLSSLGTDGNNVMSESDLTNFKELLASESSIMSQGKDIEFFLTNTTKNNPATGEPLRNADGSFQYRAFDDITDDLSTWKNLSTNAFASQNAVTQDIALEKLYRANDPAYMKIIQQISDNPTALGNVKQKVYEKFSIYSTAQYEAAKEKGITLPPLGTFTG